MSSIATSEACSGLQCNSVWNSLSPVERTAVQVSLGRWKSAACFGKQLFEDKYDAAIVKAAMPEDEQCACIDKWSKMSSPSRVAMRTAAIDFRFKVLNSGDGPALRQIVIVGAGLDSRAWRLPWPPGTTVYEVDSGSCEDLKMAVLQQFPLQCERRAFVKADLGHPADLVDGLTAAGFDKHAPTIWLLEGLVGYLSREQGAALFNAMAEISPAGSHVIMTAPPTPEVFQRAADVGFPLHHQTRENSSITLARLVEAGWRGKVVPGRDLAEQFGLINEDDGHPQDWQDQIYAERAL